MSRPMRRGSMMMMSDPAARLLDQQTLLQLSGAQVTQLIAIHESSRKQQRALVDKVRSLFPRTQAQRQAPTATQRDSMASLMDALRTARWRATSDADSVLTPDQRHEAARLELARRASMRGSGQGRGGAGGGGAWGGMRGRGMSTPRGRLPNGRAASSDSSS
ncbi:MAG TPA: Spy/CpxP family protein refolding chaperone [Gemmatimonadaceae bacterium]